MKSLAVLAALIAVISAAVLRSVNGNGGDLFKRQDNCRTADSSFLTSVDFCNDNDPFFTRCCDGLKCVVENDPSIGRTKVCR
ncbi:hypothetical protein CPAR01_13128 [Colletotrichum paranaense]|uniref:Uncharacterized protein n=1 Tax=Colletotrichum paranaense TaxID=1914294 RepID=A0ABQ9S5U5_9PEZI|nr:uncharacterized protein CPAR01_13128 [Colletotrichum paranaense]KAK1526600.1 hypothetical protein CPAR01_13128 [Colletotrichum paranaense]